MSLVPPQFDHANNIYLTVYLRSLSPFLADPQVISAIHSALTYVGPVGVMSNVQILSVPVLEWERVLREVLVSLSSKADIEKVKVLDAPRTRVKRGGEL